MFHFIGKTHFSLVKRSLGTLFLIVSAATSAFLSDICLSFSVHSSLYIRMRLLFIFMFYAAIFRPFFTLMTVRYSEDVAFAKPFRFVKLLFRWRGSFYKLIVYEFTIYFAIYMSLNVLHSFILSEEQDVWFTEFCAELGRMSGYVVGSVTFCLGFFIQQVYRRFCYHFQVVPWPDGFAFLVSVNVRGEDMRGRLLRRTMVRYAVASIILTWMNFSERMQVLFPDLESLVLGGFLTESEVNILKSVSRPAWRQMVAASWAAAVIKRARMEDRIEDDYAYNEVLRELDTIRMKCRRLIQQNNRPVPLAYFHTVIIGVYSFFLIAAVAGSHRLQTLNLHKEVMSGADSGEKWTLRLFSELVTLLQFSICAGVLAISRSLIAPFGMDDDNIDVEEIVKRHLSIAYLIVDELHSLIPQLSDAAESGHHLEDQSVSSTPPTRRGSYYANFEGESLPERPGYLLSFAPSAKKDANSPDSPAISPIDEVRDRFLKTRSHSKLQRLLSFRKLN